MYLLMRQEKGLHKTPKKYKFRPSNINLHYTTKGTNFNTLKSPTYYSVAWFAKSTNDGMASAFCILKNIYLWMGRDITCQN